VQSKRFHWWKALSILIAANLFSALPVGYAGDKVFYNSFLLPSIAPPDWVFAPVWLFLNITSLIALYRIANLPASKNRSNFLVSEALGWILFAIFTTVYFLMKSPILGAIDTVLGLVVAIYSIALARTIDRRAALCIFLRLVWLCLASYVSVWVALYNQDQLFSTSAFFMR
jgi:translocator protein